MPYNATTLQDALKKQLALLSALQNFISLLPLEALANNAVSLEISLMLFFFFSQSSPRTNTWDEVPVQVSPAIYNLISWELQNSLKTTPLFKAMPYSFSGSLFFHSLHVSMWFWSKGSRNFSVQAAILLAWQQRNPPGHLSHFLRFRWEIWKTNVVILELTIKIKKANKAVTCTGRVCTIAVAWRCATT